MQPVIDFLRTHRYLIDMAQAVAIIIGTIVLRRIIPVIEKKFIRAFTAKTAADIDDRIAALLIPGIRRLILIAGIYAVITVLAEYLGQGLTSAAVSGCYVIVLFVAAGLVSKMLQALLEWYSANWEKRVESRVSADFGPLFKRLIAIIVYTVAMVMMLHHFKQNVSSIIVSLGVGSLAVALAAKDTLANMIAGFMIMTDRPFRIGDRILLESGQLGDVFDIGLRSTRIKTFDNTLIVVPNHQIVNEKVTNLSYPDPQIRVAVEVGVAYGTDVDKVKRLLTEVCSSHPDVLSEPPPAAYFVNFGESSLDFKVVCRVPEWGMQWQTAEDIRTAVNSVFKREGIEIPFPQRVVTHIHPAQRDA